MGIDVLLLNLTRFGDLLQSQPLIHDLHDSGHSVGLICLDNFAPALPLLRHVDAAWALPGAKFMAELDRHWQGAAAHVLGLVRSVREEARPRQVINLTPSLPGRLLGKMLAPSPEALLGFALDAEGFGVNRGVWASFLSGATLRRLNAPFNLVDMLRMLGAPLLAPGMAARPGRFQLQKPSAEALAHAEDLLGQVENMPDGAQVRGFVAFQLGASEARRQWPVGHFAALGERLWREAGLCPVLLGAPAESPLATAYLGQSQSPCVNAVGRTNIPQLAALLGKTRLLVTNDTGTMHLAAGLSLPCLAFFLATAQPCDTGPYLSDCCCLEPALTCHPCPYGQACPHGHACLARISPRHAGDMVLARLAGGHWQKGLSPDLCREARVWLTGVDAHGFAEVRSLSGHEAEDRSRWLVQQRLFWRHVLDGMDCAPSGSPAAEGRESAWRADALAPALACVPNCSPAFCREVAPVLEQAARLLSMLGEQGRLTGLSARAGHLFLRNCERLQNTLDACPPLSSLGCFWRELRQERGGRMEDLLTFVDMLAGRLQVWAAHVGCGRQEG